MLRILSVLLLLCASHAVAAKPQTAPASRPWTFMIYAACDNNAEADGNFFAFLDGVRSAMDDSAGFDIILCMDRSTRYSNNSRTLGEDFTDTRLYQVRKSGCTRLSGSTQFPEITLTSKYEANSADPVNIRKFISFCKSNYPAKYYGLMLYGHAGASDMLPDEEPRAIMGFAQLTDVVTAVERVDIMALELCQMGGIEISYQWRPGNGGFSTDNLVAIPNSGPPLDWARVFNRIRAGASTTTLTPTTLTPQDFAKMIVEEGGNGRRENNERNECVAAYDLTRAAAVKTAVDALAVQLARSDTKATIRKLRGPEKGSSASDSVVLNYVNNRLDEEGPCVDLYDLCARIANCETLDVATRAAAKGVLPKVDDLILASYGGPGLPRFEPGKCGIYIILPDGDAEFRSRSGKTHRVWDMCDWYTPLSHKEYYGKLAWCADGAIAKNSKVENWFELLDMWFDDVKGGVDGKNGWAW